RADGARRGEAAGAELLGRGRGVEGRDRVPAPDRARARAAELRGRGGAPGGRAGASGGARAGAARGARDGAGAGRARAGAAGGATAILLLSAPVRAAVRDVTAPDGTPARVYVDLPHGTRLGRGALRAVPASAPVGRARVGVGEHGEIRVVLDLESPATYRVRRDGRRLVLVLAPIAESRAPAPPAPPPPAPTLPPRPNLAPDPGPGR